MRLGEFVEKGLDNLIEQQKSAILKKWFDLAIQAYEPDTAKFLKNQKDPFGNPVGNNTLKGLQGLLDQLLGEFDPRTVETYLDPIIRIRAAQAFTPSQATAFIFSFKKVLRDTLGTKLHDDQIMSELLAIESKIDQLCLMAFDLFVACKEKIYQIRANETRNRTFRAFERAGLIVEDTDDLPEKRKTSS
jgi:hypothetical protein